VSFGCFMLAQSGPGDPKVVRAPAVAGQFYPANGSVLKEAIQAYLADAVAPRTERPLALVVPHAGYVYSAQITADAFRQAASHRYDLVVILGANHSAAGFNRISVYSGAGYRTPLGVAATDRAAAEALVKEDAECVLDQAAQAKEHSVEVQVPFVQHLFPGVKILAIVVGTDDQAACERLGRALAKILKDRQPLIVASSDLSHYPSAADAPGIDRKTLEAIATMRPDTFRNTANVEMARGVAGWPPRRAALAAPILAAMTASSALGATRGIVISYANSSHVAVGDPARVVGYGAVVLAAGERGRDTSALDKPAADARVMGPLDAADKKALLVLARETLRRYLTTETLPLLRGFSPRAEREQGAFVTLKERGQLRGCIGQIIGTAPLSRTVSMMALEAALNDPASTRSGRASSTRWKSRFPPSPRRKPS
jgi:AmmeMemoRadiSam system protein B